MTTMMEPREKWTDDRLDDLNKKVDAGFARVDSDIRELRAEVKNQGEGLRAEIASQGESLRSEITSQGETLTTEMKGFRAEMIAGFAKIDKRFEAVDDRFHTVYRVIIGAALALAVSLLGGLFGSS